MPKISDAKHKANEKYNAKAYDEIKTRVPKGKKSIIQDYAKQQGKSLNAYILDLIKQDMKDAYTQ